MPELGELLVFGGVEKSFARQKALHSISFAISAGQISALVGPPGSGKTTILRLSTGVDAPSRGSVFFEGNDVRGNEVSVLARIGTVFGDTGLDRSRSVHSNLRFAANIHGVRAEPAEARIAALLARFNLTAKERDNVGSLGEIGQRLIAVAQAVMHGPRLLLIDAIADALDPAARSQLADGIARLCTDEKMAVLWASEQADLASTAGKLIVLGRGQVLFDGPPKALLGDARRDSLSAAVTTLIEGQATR